MREFYAAGDAGRAAREVADAYGWLVAEHTCEAGISSLNGAGFLTQFAGRRCGKGELVRKQLEACAAHGGRQIIMLTPGASQTSTGELGSSRALIYKRGK